MKKSRFLVLLLSFLTLSLAVSCASLPEELGSLFGNQSSESCRESESFNTGDRDSEDSSSIRFPSSTDGDRDTDTQTDTDTYVYTDFTLGEKQTLVNLFGEVIPFAPNDEYCFEEYEENGEEGINFYTYGNTQADFNAYRGKFTAYTLLETYLDEYGDTWYVYQKGEYYVEFSYYYYDADWVLDVYAYILGDTGGDTQTGTVLTNDGKGLPAGVDGVYNVDFTAATNVKNATDQVYYQDGCPTTGKVKALVIPVQFSDRPAQGVDYTYTISALENAFKRGGTNDYYSVADYYYISSYGQLELDFTVWGEWFEPKYTSTYYKSKTTNYGGESTSIGDQMIMDEALAYLEPQTDLSQFDSDDNGIIDAIVMISTVEIGDDDFNWAYRYQNIYTNKNGEYYEYDGVSANDYVWASYQFLYESYDSRGKVTYTDALARNTYTYIHEFGHILGADDYYDTEGKASPMGGYDVMDSALGDQNAYTKFNLGWITSSRLVTTDTEVTLTLDDFSKTGDTIILANNWDSELGAYQEYYVVVYYTNNGLNTGKGGYFSSEGIVVYHVNASLYKIEAGGNAYYYTNNSNDYSSEDKLIEYVTHGSKEYVYGAGDTLPETSDDNGEQLRYTFTVDSLTEESATLTFTKI